MAGSFTVLSHTADTGVAVTADTLGELFEWTAMAMFSLMYPCADLVPERHHTVAVQAAELPELMVDLLAELLYLSEAEDVAACRFRAAEASATQVRLDVGLVALQPDMLQGPPIKAVTYHDLEVARSADGWTARVVFDV